MTQQFTFDLESTESLYRNVSLISSECQQCEWLIACGGGCAYQRWLNGGFGAQFPQCNIRRELFKHIKRKVGDLAKYKTVMIDS